VFGPDREAKKVYQRFGPLNSAVGHRRLNVLFTRAKESVVVFTSLRPDDILVDGEGVSQGRQALRGYLEYARTGRLHSGSLSGREPDSEFEQMVWERLRREGYKADCQVGVAGYFVDLAVQHPLRATHYVLGVECDGAAYHSFKSARDRDRLRQEILENLGWKIHRIWSTDWFQNPEREVRRLLERLKIEEKAANFDDDNHIDYAKFASVSDETPSLPKRPRRRAATQMKMSFGSPRSSSTAEFHVPLGEVDTYLTALRARADGSIVRTFEQSLDFSNGAPATVVIESVRQGAHRILELEELYNGEAFRWSRSNKGQSLSRLPWAANLTVGENLHLREFAISALLKSGWLS
jgi:very-short-patch-repair endonuclease